MAPLCSSSVPVFVCAPACCSASRGEVSTPLRPVEQVDGDPLRSRRSRTNSTWPFVPRRDERASPRDRRLTLARPAPGRSSAHTTSPARAPAGGGSSRAASRHPLPNICSRCARGGWMRRVDGGAALEQAPRAAEHVVHRRAVERRLAAARLAREGRRRATCCPRSRARGGAARHWRRNFARQLVSFVSSSSLFVVLVRLFPRDAASAHSAWPFFAAPPECVPRSLSAPRAPRPQQRLLIARSRANGLGRWCSGTRSIRRRARSGPPSAFRAARRTRPRARDASPRSAAGSAPRHQASRTG